MAGFSEYQSMLEQFTNDEEIDDMRTYIGPEKHQHANSVLPSSGGVTKKETKLPMVSSRTDGSFYDTGAHSTTLHKNSTYKAPERHKFSVVTDVTCGGCSSGNGEYSEIIMTVWLDGKSVSGSTASFKYRVVVSLMHDAESDLWSLSGRMVKRYIYQSKDEDDIKIENRLCTAAELRGEVKRMMLFFNINPYHAYRKFLRSTAYKATVNRSEYGYVTVEDEKQAELMKNIDKVESTSSSSGFSGMGTHYNHNTSPEHYANAIRGDASGVNNKDYHNYMMGAGSWDSC